MTNQIRKTQIMDAMMQVMARQGYHGASIADLAACAGMNPGLVHYHFKSKLDILLAVLDRLLEAHLARVRVESLDEYIDLHLSLGESADPVALACWVVIGAEAVREPRVREAYERAVVALVEACPAPREVAVPVVAAIQGYYLLGANAREVVPRGSAAQAVKRMAGALWPS